MAAISAALVKQLRDRTGQSMMDCKNALTETDGDMEKAVDLLRKKGMAVMEKRSDRENKEGQIVSKVNADGKIAVLTALCCETDFTSKSENFQKAAELLANALLAASSTPADTEGLKPLADKSGKTVDAAINEIMSQTGEKVTLGNYARFELPGSGLIYTYVHFNGKVGTMIQIDAENNQAASASVTQTLASDLAMHITAINPVSVSRDEVPADTIEKEKEIAREQIKNKPAEMVEKIIEGKINKWLSEIVLLEQPFVKDDSKKVCDLVAEVSKAAGGQLTVKRFARIQIG